MGQLGFIFVMILATCVIFLILNARNVAVVLEDEMLARNSTTNAMATSERNSSFQFVSSTTNATATSERSSSFQFVSTPNPGAAIQLTGDLTRICSRRRLSGHVQILGGSCSNDSLGNVLSGLYLAALRAFQRNSTFELTSCSKSGLQRSYLSNRIWKMTLPQAAPNLCQSCNSWPHTCRQGLNYAVPMIRETLRQVPPPTDMDDVTIHIRCGDLLGYAHHVEYGYPKYAAYKEILTTFTSIGILTGNFDPTKARAKDIPYAETCFKLIQDMAHYFQDTFPNATVTIRSNDTVEEAVGRMVHSKQTWCNPSTFCVYPAIATTGQAYILQSPKLYPFVEEISEPNIQVVNQIFLNMNQIVNGKMNATDIIGWLRN